MSNLVEFFCIDRMNTISKVHLKMIKGSKYPDLLMKINESVDNFLSDQDKKKIQSGFIINPSSWILLISKDHEGELKVYSDIIILNYYSEDSYDFQLMKSNYGSKPTRLLKSDIENLVNKQLI